MPVNPTTTGFAALYPCYALLGEPGTQNLYVNGKVPPFIGAAFVNDTRNCFAGEKRSP